MRNPVVQPARPAPPEERREVLRIAIRQLERADLYLGAVAVMDLEDRAATRALAELRRDVDALRHHLIDLRTET